MGEFCISHGSMIAFFMCSGQIHNDLHQVSLVRYSVYQKWLKLVHFWLSYS